MAHIIKDHREDRGNTKQYSYIHDGLTHRQVFDINYRFRLVSFRVNGDPNDRLFQLHQLKEGSSHSDEQTEWFVRASFRYVSELMNYLKSFGFEDDLVLFGPSGECAI